jgi:hypothetical protein
MSQKIWWPRIKRMKRGKNVLGLKQKTMFPPFNSEVNRRGVCRKRLGSSRKGEVRDAFRGQEIVSVASQGVRFTCISCVPVYQPQTWRTSCVPRLVRNCTSCIERYGCTKCPKIWRFLHSVIVLYFTHNYMHTYRTVEWYRQHSCYIMLLSKV